MDLLYNIDRLFTTEQGWTISAWAIKGRRRVTKATLRLGGPFGTVEHVLAIGVHRPDVVIKFGPGLGNEYAGIIGFGSLPSRDVRSFHLVLEFDDSSIDVLEIGGFHSTQPTPMRTAMRYARSARHLIRSGRYAEFFGRSRRVVEEYVRRRRIQKRAIDREAPPRDVVLVFDHAMGGGSNLFSEELVRKELRLGHSVMVVRYSIHDLRFNVEMHSPEAVASDVSSFDIGGLRSFLEKLTPTAIHLNSLASIPTVIPIIGILTKFIGRRQTCESVYYLHDFHPICPSFTLLNADGRYCGVPEESVCNGVCLPRHSSIFVSSQEIAEISGWRSEWQQLLEAVSTVRAFSRSSADILLRTFPELAPKLVIGPHEPMETIQPKPLRAGTPPIIGVFGILDDAKGARVVEALADHIREMRSDARIVVVGTISRSVDPAIARVTGPYKRKNLAHLVERHGINRAFFSSIWPETFSFVVSELMELELPIVAFDIGAQGERLRGHPRATLVPLDSNPADILAALSPEGATPEGRELGSPYILAHPLRSARICAFTSAATNYLPKAQLLAESIKHHHPEFDVVYGLCDELAPTVDYERGVFDYVVPARDAGIPAFERWSFQHSIVEMSTGIKPFVMAELRDRGYEKVIYFDPDIVLFSRLDDMVADLEDAALVLTPHQTQAESDYQAIIDNEICSLQHGTYNLGFLGLNCRNPESARFLDWWADRLYKWCVDDIPNGLFTDQKWIDLVPALFADVRILRESRLNVSTWNLTQRSLRGSRAEGLFVDGKPLGFYHFTGFDSGAHRVMAFKNSRNNPDVMRLVDWYEGAIKLAPSDPAASVRWAYGSYSNGEPIRPVHRRIYRNRGDLQKHFSNPYEVGHDGGLSHWFNTQGPLEYPDQGL